MLEGKRKGAREGCREGGRERGWKGRNEAGRREKRRNTFATAADGSFAAVPEFHIISLENGFDHHFFRRPLTSSRPVTLVGVLEVDSDISTHRAREEVWFVPG